MGAFRDISWFAKTLNEVERAQMMDKAQAGDAKSRIAIGERYCYGINGVPRDYIQAKAWYERAIAQNDHEAMYCLAYL